MGEHLLDHPLDPGPFAFDSEIGRVDQFHLEQAGDVPHEGTATRSGRTCDGNGGP